MEEKEYTLTESGTYTVTASDSSGSYQDSSPSTPATYSAPKKLFKINNKICGKLNSKFVDKVNEEEVMCGALPLLNTPTNLSISGTDLSFNDVAGADSYEIFANGNSIGSVVA